MGKKSQIVNVPNMLTLSRIVLIFVFVLLASAKHIAGFPPESFKFINIIAYSLAIIAGITDFLDGYIARKYNMVTDFGALMDPLADKIFITATMLIMVEVELMPAWIAVIVISREFMVTGLRLIATSKNIVISADGWGKTKTLLQMVMLGIAGTSWIKVFDLKTAVWFGVKLWPVWNVYMWVIVVVTVFSGFRYFANNLDLFRDDEDKEAGS
ncbi:MAG: CDP-diacylglycerol--glycerol-3-phosphate 3-phosphatidyltransferase [Victivallaceae bacterium]|nr:CDP-diacylglycerol--glycerol-3-phosphate 3-phosphatidyltransferase [Victivallaceae bacterium]